MEKMKLLRKRDFGTLLNDSITFTFQNFGRYTKSFLYIVMPPITLMVVGVFFMYLSIGKHSGSASFTSSTPPGLDKIFILLPVLLAAFVLIIFVSLVHTLLSYQYMLLYENKEDPAQITVSEIWARIKADIFTLLGAYMGLMILIIVAVLIMAAITYILYTTSGSSVLSGLFVFIMFFAWAYLSVALSNYFMIILRERCGVSDALRRCFILIKGNWWRTFGMMMVIGLLTYIFQMICLLPFTVVNVINSMHNITTQGLHAKPVTGGPLYAITQAVSMAVGFYFSVFMSFAICINYYSLAEEKDNTTLLEEIGQIGEKPDNTHAQEGSY